MIPPEAIELETKERTMDMYWLFYTALEPLKLITCDSWMSAISVPFVAYFSWQEKEKRYIE